MLALIRQFAKTWPARILFAALVGAFGLWGIAGSLRSQDTDTAVAHVDGTRIEFIDAQRAYSRQIADMAKANPGEQSPALRLQVARQAVRQLILQTALANAQTTLGIVTPDAAVRDATFALPAFHNANGAFDHATFVSVLARNGLDEASFIKLVRADEGHKQVIGAIEAGVAAPALLADPIFAFARESRVASAVLVPFAGDPGTPTEAQLRRLWANNPATYATPEYRRIKAVVLSALTLAPDMKVTDDDIKTYYNAERAKEYDKPERRSLQVLTTPDAAEAGRLSVAWRTGLAWDAMQAQSKAAGATALELPDASRIELPDAALADAAFASAPSSVTAPVKGAFGWYVVKVTHIAPALHISLDQARAEIRQKIGVLKAADAIDDRANKLEDALAGGGLDTLPQGLGVAAVEGTLDATGMTPQGTPAPLPAEPDLRAAIIAAAFKARPGDPPHLDQLAATKENQGGGYYAVTVDRIIPPASVAYETAASRLRADWAAQQQRHTAETTAAAVLAATRAGTTLAAAAAAHALVAQTLPPVRRPIGTPESTPGVPDSLIAPLFTLKPEEATMIETPEGFMVAQLQHINVPGPESDRIGAGQLRGQLTRSLASDVTDEYVLALERAAKVSMNEKLVGQMAQP